jgi:aconitate hydratase
MQILKNGVAADIMETGAVLKTAFCGPCFGAGDTPSNNAFSIRHSTRNFPNREGSKVQDGQIASVALMDARSIAATAANHGVLTSAEEFDGDYTKPKYYFDRDIYKNRVFDSHGKPDPDTDLKFGPNIKDWPAMQPLPENLLLKVVSEIHDPVTTTDELIPSGETSSYRSNPLKLAEFTLSRKDPEYVGRAKEVKKAYDAFLEGKNPAEALSEIGTVLDTLEQAGMDVARSFGIGSTIFAVKPGDGSAREQAASCQKVLGGWANIANEYATKRYRSNLINWGMVPFTIPRGDLPFSNGDYIYVKDLRKGISSGGESFEAFAVSGTEIKKISLNIDSLTPDEREIILKGCLINYYRA